MLVLWTSERPRITAYAAELDAGGAKALVGDPWGALSRGLAPLVNAAVACAASQ